MISSTHNPLVQRARKLRKRGLRARTREFLVEGAHGITEAFSAGQTPELLFLTESAPVELADLARASRVPVHAVSEPVMKLISDAENPPGAVAVVPFVDVEPGRLLACPTDLAVVLAGVQDPGNLGTTLRTARAAGAGAVFLTEGTVDLYNAKVVRASAGALFRVSVAREVAVPWVLAGLGSRGFRRIAAVPTAPTAYDEVDMSGPCALVFGNEARGLGDDVLAAVDERASIPMDERAESLNVGISAAVFLFEVSRQRRAR
ncbi:MAG TPA: RNA methyltransferase [Actinomycetota bacterium]|nr:RNA methyltransferase [Actinomycetota bacterium]